MTIVPAFHERQKPTKEARNGNGIKELDDGRLLEVHLTGKLVRKDYEAFSPAVKRLVKKHGKIRMLVEMHAFQGWSAGALWRTSSST